MMFANYGARHFPRKHRKSNGRGSAPGACRGSRRATLSGRGLFCIGEKEHERRKRKEQKTENVKVNFPAKDCVSDVINLSDFGYAVS